MAITSTQPKTVSTPKIGDSAGDSAAATSSATSATSTSVTSAVPPNPIGTGKAKLLKGDTQEQDNALQLLKYDGYAVANAQTVLTTLKAGQGSEADIADATEGLNEALKTYADDLTRASDDTHLDGARIHRYLTGGAHPVPDNAVIPESGADLSDFIDNLTEMAGGDAAGVNEPVNPAVTDDAKQTPGTAISQAAGNLLLTASQQKDLMNSQQVLSTATIAGVTSGSLADDFKLYPAGMPVATDINQQSDTDCYYLGSLASMASTSKGQATLQNAISEPDAQGDYTVKLYDPKNNPVEIKVNPNNLPIKEDNSSAFNEGSDGKANWASLLEAAYAKYNDVYRTNTNPDNATKSGYDGIMENGVDDTSFIQALTGTTDVVSHAIDAKAGATTTDKIATNIAARLDAGVPVLAYNTDSEDVTDSANRTWVSGHAYAVTQIEGNQVTIQNPWGDNSPQSGFKKGVTTMSMADFMKTFEHSLY
jgi:hypothetical protein